jgi:hypothetical protein
MLQWNYWAVRVDSGVYDLNGLIVAYMESCEPVIKC